MTVIRERIHIESRIRSERVAAILGIALGLSFSVCFVTGLYSHLAQHPPGWFELPARPAGLYRRDPGRARRDRDRVDPTPARQALGDLSEAVLVAAVLERRTPGRTGGADPVDGGWPLHARQWPREHQPLVSLAVQLPARRTTGWRGSRWVR